jgi:L-ectoine synthase
MKVKDEEMMHTFEPERCIVGKGFESIRFILEKDNMGFSLHKTIIPKGGPYNWHYTKHKEACFCIKGDGELVNLDNGDRFTISEGTIYILDNHDNHTFEAFEDVELISVFNPPVKGNEIHKDDGSYEA